MKIIFFNSSKENLSFFLFPKLNPPFLLMNLQLCSTKALSSVMKKLFHYFF